MIRHEGEKWILFSKDGNKRLGEFDTEAEAKEREAQIVAAAQEVQEGAGVPNVADGLEAVIHRSFTIEADHLFQDGQVDRDERIALSSMIGDALGVFSQRLDAELPDLRTRPSKPPDEKLYASARELIDTWDRSLTEATLDEAGNLSGVIVVEGLSANGNDYTAAALKSGPAVFAGKPIYINHPTRTESRERPERDERDKVGRLPGAEDIFVEALPDGRKTLRFRNGKLSKTANWLATKIREGISGAMSINASGNGHEHENGNFIVEAFTAATSLDFVTEAAAGGKAIVESQQRSHIEVLAGLTLKDLAEARPDIVDDIARRERRKAYGEKRELGNLREILNMTQNGNKTMAQRLAALEAYNARLTREQRTLRASAIVDKGLAEQPDIIRRRVRRLVESDQRAFVEQDAPAMSPEPPGELAPANPDAQAGDPPKIELPPDAAQLPDAAQAIFLETYTAHIAEGEEMATHKAWAAVSAAGWIKDETSGQWGQVDPEVIANLIAEELGGEGAAGTEETTVVTEESLAETVARLVQEERAELATLTGAGAIHGMGAGASLDQPVDAEQQRADLVESFVAGGMTQKQAELAAAGRPAQRGV